MKEIDISINLPAYKESENLRILIPKIINNLVKLNLSFEINVVDTIYPLDSTLKIVNSYKKVNYFNREFSNSFGDAYRTAIKNSKGIYTIFMDADGSHSPNFLNKMISHIGKHDVIIASRYVKGGKTDNSAILTFMSRLLNLIYSSSLGINCKDVSNSFKLYKTSHLKSLNLYCNNFDIIEEILYKLSKNDKSLSIKEIPYYFRRRLHGQTKRKLFLFIVTFIITLFKLRFNIR
jgi:dolichol-phosphate mannosyltransferase